MTQNHSRFVVITWPLSSFQNEIHDKDRVFNALAKTGENLMGKMAEDERTMLGSKLSEMSSRWKALQNNMLDINLNLRPSGSGAMDTDADASTFSHVSLAHANLRDHMDWVLRKKRELSALSLDGDVKGLRRQLEEHSGFKHQLHDREVHIRNGLNLASKLLDQSTDERPDFQACVSNLELEWRELLERSSEWHEDILRMVDNVKGFEDRIKELKKL